MRRGIALCLASLLFGCRDVHLIERSGNGGSGGDGWGGTGGSGGGSSVCGDGLVQPGEACDGANLGDASCERLGYDLGNLRCSSACELDASDCRRAEICGNGTDDDGDGRIDCDDRDCRSDPSCPQCGDGSANGSEACDGTDLRGATCQSVGFDDGALACSSSCDLITDGCTRFERCDNSQDDDGDGLVDCDDPDCMGRAPCPFCGDGVIDADEACDGPVTGVSCADFGFSLGSVRCTESCSFDLELCGEPERCDTPGDEDKDGLADCADPDCDGSFHCPVCENDIVQAGEECDGADVSTCGDLGFEAGATVCSDDCRIDSSGCRNIVCGDGFADGPERCDDGNVVSGDGCSSGCHVEGDVCEAPIDLTWDGATSTWVWNGDTSVLYPDYAGTCAETTAAPDAIARFTAPTAGRFFAKVGAQYDTVLAAWKGSCGSGAHILACIDDYRSVAAETIEFELGAGEVAYLFLAPSSRGGSVPAGGPFHLEVGEVRCGDGIQQGWEQCEDGNTVGGDGCSADCRWEGDSCTDAIDLDLHGLPGPHWPEWFIQGPADRLWISSTTRFTNDTEGDCVPTAGRDGIARFVAPHSGVYVFTLIAEFDAALYVLEDACGGTPVERTCGGGVDGGPPPGQVAAESIVWPTLQAGEVVYLVVDGLGTDEAEHGAFWLHVRNRVSFCGNGTVDSGEECDDGNRTPGDGCSNLCLREPRLGSGGEPNPTLATVVSPSMTYQGLFNASTPGPQFWRLDAAGGTSYRIEAIEGIDLVGRVVPDLRIRLLDDSLMLITESGDGSPRGPSAARIDWTAPSSGTYYVQVDATFDWPPYFGGLFFDTSTFYGHAPYTFWVDVVP